MYKANTPVRYIKGLGPTRSRELNKLGIHTVLDLLERKPLSYIFPGVTPIEDARDGQVVVKANVVEIGRRYGHVVGATVCDKTGHCQAQWYTPYAVQQLRQGMTVTFYGKYKSGVLQSPKWCTHDGGMESVYGGQYGVHHQTIRAALVEVLANVELPMMTTDDGCGEFPRVWAFNAFHFPDCKEDQRDAIDDLKRDEALTLQTALQERRRGREQGMTRPIAWNGNQATKITDHFSYVFTKDQNTAKNDIIDDLSSSIPMSRLIHGEVGSGKTAVAFYAAMLTALNSKRALILAPTTILAQQHYDTLKGMGWKDVAIDIAGSCLGDVLPAHIMIGTHSILNHPTITKRSSLVIIDEMQKFGVAQRAQATKHHPHLLLLSATPIPRTLAATVFGDLDVSVIRQLPIERGTVVTRWVLPEKREAMYEIIEKELAKGKQAYVVYPRISGCVERVVSADNGYMDLRERFSDKYRVSLLTGRTDAKCKVDILRDFKAGVTHVMVSTIIAEVGLDNPNATVMCVEGADRFGLSQLHQLRGRVCRSTDTAFCFLVSETANPTSIARLEVIEKCNDGFEIAEHDLRLRGAGEVFSARQTGLPDLRWCSVVDDYDLMIEAKELVASGSVGSGVREMMVLKYGESLYLGEVT